MFIRLAQETIGKKTGFARAANALQLVATHAEVSRSMQKNQWQNIIIPICGTWRCAACCICLMRISELIVYDYDYGYGGALNDKTHEHSSSPMNPINPCNIDKHVGLEYLLG